MDRKTFPNLPKGGHNSKGEGRPTFALSAGDLDFEIGTNAQKEKFDLEAIRNGKDQPVLFGRAHYKDQFGESHRLRYCFTFRGEVKRWQPCLSYNSSD